MEIFFEIGLLVIFAGIGTYLASLIKQPLIPAYILSGVLVGNAFGLVTNGELISNLSEIGIAFLLFMVGLEMEFKKLKDIGTVSSVAGTLQIAAVFGLGYLVTRLIGFSKMEAIYLSVVIALSSTMLVIKILSDNMETNTIHGRLAIGILIVQDIFAIVALSYLASVSDVALGFVFFAKLAAVLIAGAVLSKFVFPHVFSFAAKSREVLLGVSLSVCFMFALVFHSLGLSITIGAFVAGVLLANLPYNLEIVSKVKTLRDFFAILFFTSLGMQLNLGSVSSMLLPLTALLLLVVVAKPILIYFTLVVLGHKSRTAFITATSLAQISEFSLIIVLQGVAAGAISQNMLTLTILLAVVTMAYTSYFMKFEVKFYHNFIALMRKLGIHVMHHNKVLPLKEAYDVVLCGYDRIGYSVLNALHAQRKSVVVVDFNPDIIKRLTALGVPCIYGDAADPEVLDHLDVKQAKMVISTADSYEDNLLLLRRVKGENKYVHAIVTAHKIDQALELYQQGADYVILPHFLGGDMVSQMLEGFGSGGVQTMMYKHKHVQDLLARKDFGQDHPTHY
ncbi:MAG: cation:proton antiporter [Candidatus Woesearchaeota archaeon]